MVNIKFWSSQTKKVVRDTEERVFLKSKGDQEEILKDPKIKVEDKLFQLLKENNELLELYQAAQDQLAKEIKNGGTYAFNLEHGTFELLQNVKVTPDSYIQISKERKIRIQEPSWTGRLKSGFRLRQFRAYFFEAEGEYTIDPRDLTPIEIKQKNEQHLQLAHTAAEKNLGEALVNDLGSKVKKWWEVLGTPILMTTMVFIFLLFIGMFFGQYNFTKVPAG